MVVVRSIGPSACRNVVIAEACPYGGRFSAFRMCKLNKNAWQISLRATSKDRSKFERKFWFFLSKIINVYYFYYLFILKLF